MDFLRRSSGLSIRQLTPCSFLEPVAPLAGTKFRWSWHSAGAQSLSLSVFSLCLCVSLSPSIPSPFLLVWRSGVLLLSL